MVLLWSSKASLWVMTDWKVSVSFFFLSLFKCLYSIKIEVRLNLEWKVNSIDQMATSSSSMWFVFTGAKRSFCNIPSFSRLEKTNTYLLRFFLSCSVEEVQVLCHFIFQSFTVLHIMPMFKRTGWLISCLKFLDFPPFSTSHLCRLSPLISYLISSHTIHDSGRIPWSISIDRRISTYLLPLKTPPKMIFLGVLFPSRSKISRGSFLLEPHG